MKNNKSEIEEEYKTNYCKLLPFCSNNQEAMDRLNKLFLLGKQMKEEGILKAKDDFNKMINDFKKNTFGDKKQIINEADLQSGAIEFSYTGELYPVEKLETTFEELKQKIGEIK